MRGARSDLPPPLAGCEILSVPVADGHELGVFKDRRLGAYTAVLSVRARSLGLLPTVEHERRLDRWGRLLASLARSGSAIRRVQVLERTAPCDAAALTEFLEEASDPSVPDGHAARRSYEALLDGASRVTQDHEVLIAVQVDQRRAWSRAARDPHVPPARPRRAGVSRARSRAAGAGSPASIPSTWRSPGSSRRSSTRRRSTSRSTRTAARRSHGRQSAERDTFAPTAADTTWTTWRTDGALHRTYWIAQWPRLPVGPLFLTPLLLGAHAVRSVSITLEPVAPDRARRAVEAAITSDEADEDLRERRGFRTTARRRRQQEATLRREEELASGHEEVRFAGYVTVTGRDEDELARACEEVEQAAHQAHLDLRPLWGEQDAGFVHACAPDRARTARSGSGRRLGMRRRLGERHGHRATTANAAAIYPFFAESGLGARGAYIGRDLHGAAFTYDPFVLYEQRAISNPNLLDRGRGRLGQVVARQDVPLPPGAVRSRALDRGSEGRVRAPCQRARRRADPALPGRRGPTQPDHQGGRLGRTARPAPRARRRRARPKARAGGGGRGARGAADGERAL